MKGNRKVNESTSEEIPKICICNSWFGKISVSSLIQLADRCALLTTVVIAHFGDFWVKSYPILKTKTLKDNSALSKMNHLRF